MSSASSALRRTLLTTARHRLATPATPKPAFRIQSRPQQPFLYTTPPLRHFSATMVEKEGVHNLSTKADWDKAKADGDKLLVVDCFATWCGPCKVIAPTVAKFSDEFTDARFYKIDVDEVPDVAQELGVRAMPTFFLFKGGEKVEEVVGANPNALKAAIEKHIK